MDKGRFTRIQKLLYEWFPLLKVLVVRGGIVHGGILREMYWASRFVTFFYNVINFG